jgi:putative transposase
VRFEFIEANCERFALTRLCRLLEVSRSGFYAWRCRSESERSRKDRRLLSLIREIHQDSRCSYGSRRVWWELQFRGELCGRTRVERLMRQNNLQAFHKRRWRPKGQKGRAEVVAENVLDQDFATEAPNQAWTADITYIRTGEGWLYLAVVMDLFSRRIIGWAMDKRATRHLVIDAWKMAVKQRQPEGKVVHHSDRGTQYGSFDFQKELDTAEATCSMSGKGNCYDNAAMESFFGRLKNECMQGKPYQTRDEARSDLFRWIEGWYNSKRRHSYLGYLSPVEFEKNAAKT